MNTYIALLRSINVGSHNRLKMEILRSYCEELGWQNIQTYIQSGNVVFHSADYDPSALADALATKINNETGMKVPTVVIGFSELERVYLNNPFIIERSLPIENLYVTFLKDAHSASQITSIETAKYMPDEFIVQGKAVYLYLPHGVTDSKLTLILFEKKFNTVATARNWKTVSKLMKMAQG